MDLAVIIEIIMFFQKNKFVVDLQGFLHYWRSTTIIFLKSKIINGSLYDRKTLINKEETNYIAFIRSLCIE